MIFVRNEKKNHIIKTTFSDSAVCSQTSFIRDKKFYQKLLSKVRNVFYIFSSVETSYRYFKIQICKQFKIYFIGKYTDKWLVKQKNTW